MCANHVTEFGPEQEIAPWLLRDRLGDDQDLSPGKMLSSCCTAMEYWKLSQQHLCIVRRCKLACNRSSDTAVPPSHPCEGVVRCKVQQAKPKCGQGSGKRRKTPTGADLPFVRLPVSTESSWALARPHPLHSPQKEASAFF